MYYYLNLLFVDSTTKVTWTGDDAISFLAYAMIIIMLLSLLVTNFITTQRPKSKGVYRVPTSSNIKPNMNKF